MVGGGGGLLCNTLENSYFNGKFFNVDFFYFLITGNNSLNYVNQYQIRKIVENYISKIMKLFFL